MKIRQATLADLATIASIEKSNFSPKEAMTYQVLKERIQKTPDTFLVAEIAGQLAGYIEGPVRARPNVTDDLFHEVKPNTLYKGGYILVTSLSISPAFKGQGVGTALIAALKDLALATERLGIGLTCHEELIAYYEQNGFCNDGLSSSQYGGSIWYQMTWQNPRNREKIITKS